VPELAIIQPGSNDYFCNEHRVVLDKSRAMTLISMINGNGYPVIVSDRAISLPDSKQKVILPTTNQETYSPTPVAEFRVKTVIIKDILCIAFAGEVYSIEQVYDWIVDFFLHRPINAQTYKEMLDEIHYGNEISVLFALGGPEFTENRLMVAYSGEWIRDQSKEKLDIISCGTGASRWTEHFVNYAPYLERTGIRSVDCKQRALLSCISFLSHEQKTTELLQDGWGGGFDVVYYEKGQFHRYENLSYAFYYCNADSPDRLTSYSVIHNSYLQGNAIVRNLAADNPKIHIIRQFRDQEPLGQKLLTLDCKSYEVVSCIFIYKEGKYHSDLVVFVDDTDPSAPPMLFTTIKDDKFGVQYRPIYIDKLKEAVRLFLN